MRKPPAPALMLGSVLSIQFGQAFGKTLSGTIGASGVVAVRLGLAAVLLLLLYRPSLPRHRKDIAVVLGFGTAIAGMNLIYFALLHLPLGLASALQLLGPITLALLASRRLRDAACALLAGCGIWLFHASGSAHFSLPGVLLALAAGASMAAYLLMSSKAGARSAGGGPLALAVTWAAVLTLPLGLASRGTELLEPSVLLSGLVVAVLSAVLPYSLELAALRRLPTRTVGVLTSLEPASAGLAGVVLLGEHLQPGQWAGLACVGAAAAATVATRDRSRVGERPGREDGLDSHLRQINRDAAHERGNTMSSLVSAMKVFVCGRGNGERALWRCRLSRRPEGHGRNQGRSRANVRAARWW